MSDKQSKDIWMVEHPCDPKVKAQARKDGCRVVDIRYANAFPADRVKKVVKKSKPVESKAEDTATAKPA